MSKQSRSRGLHAALVALAALASLPAPASGGPDDRIQARVVQSQGDVVTIGCGLDQKVQRRMVFDVYQPAKLVTLPMTKEPVYIPEKVIARLVVVDVEKSTSKARFMTAEKGYEVKPGDAVISNPYVAPENAKPYVRETAVGKPSGVWWGEETPIALTVTNEPEDRLYVEWSCTGGILSATRTLLPEVRWRAPLAAGDYVVKAVVKDSAGNATTHEVKVKSLGENQDPEAKRRPFLFQRSLTDHQRVFRQASDVATDEKGAYHVLDPRARRLTFLDANFEPTAGTEDWPSSYDFRRVLVRGGYAYLLDVNNLGVSKFAIKPKMFGEKPLLFLGGKGENNGLFRAPVDFDIAQNGDVYVVDKERGSVQVFDAEGRFLLSLGAPGQGPAQLGAPSALALGRDGRLFVLDDGRKKVLVWKDHRFEREFDAGGKTESFRDLKVDPFTGVVYVLEGSLGQVKRFGPDGEPRGAPFGRKGRGIGMLQEPLRMRFDGVQGLFVVDAEGERIHRFGAAGEAPAYYGGYDFAKSQKVAAAPNGECVLLDVKTYEVARIDRYGWVVAQFGGEGKAVGKFDEAVDLACDAEGYVYVLDKGNGRVNKFAPDGQLVISFCKPGKGATELYKPLDISVGGDRVVVLQDRDDYELNVSDLKGNFVTSFPADGKPLDGDGNACAQDPRQGGPVHVAYDSKKFCLFAPGGGLTGGGLTGMQGVSEVTDLEVTVAGYTIACDYGNYSVLVLDPASTAPIKIKDEKNCPKPIDVAADAYGAIYVFDYSEGRLVRYGR